MQNSNGFMLFSNQRKLLDLMTSEQKGALLDSLYAYNDGEPVEHDDPTVKMAFIVISSSIDRVKAHAERNRRAGSIGGRVSASRRQAEASGAKQTLAEGRRRQAQNENENENGEMEEQGENPPLPLCGNAAGGDASLTQAQEKEASPGSLMMNANKQAMPESGNAAGNVPGDSVSRQRSGAAVPTLEDVAAYCLERNNGIEPQRFCDYYAAQGWRLSNGRKMRDWKAAVRNWERRDSAGGQAPFALPARRGTPRMKVANGLPPRTIAEKRSLEAERRAELLLQSQIRRLAMSDEERARELGLKKLPPGW